MNWRTNRMRLLMPGLILAIAGGCIEREGRPVNPCTQVTIGQDIAVSNVDKVDLLFLVDNSGSMAEEQASLTAELENMVRILTTGDFNQDGDTEDEGDFIAVKDLNVGVITSDMGTGGYEVPTCENPEYGDDGILRTVGGGTGCEATYPAFLNFTMGDDAAAFASQVACVASTGTNGCGFEQQLEALLKAVTPTAAQPWNAPDFVPVGTPDAAHGLNVPFFNMSGGNADDENRGFFRENAVLALIPVTDEEDCSAKDPSIFDQDSATYTGILNLRCFDHKSALHPISRYVEGLLQARARPNLLIYAPITGIPVDLVPAAGESPNYPALISDDPEMRDPRMQEVVDPSMPSQLTPSCNVPGRGIAFPPIRIVQTAQALQAAGAGVTVQSICQESYAGALREVIRQIASALGAACLSQPLNKEANGKVNCEVVTEMPPDMGCDAYPGSVEQTDESGNPVLSEDGNAICVVPQIAADGVTEPEGQGWFYDDFTSEGQENCGTEVFQRIAFIGVQPPTGAIVRLECFLSVQGDGTDEVQIGTFCDPESDTNACTDHQLMSGADLACDPISRACGVTCNADTDCRNAGLVGYVCDKRPLSEIDMSMSSTEPHKFCVNPTCG